MTHLAEKPPQLIYSNEPGTDAIAPLTPHYAMWSPDSRKLAIIANTSKGGLTLFVCDVSGTGQPAHQMDGGPLYMSWSGDSRYLLVHSRRAHYLVDTRESQDVRQMPGSSTLYMAPSWSPTSNRMAIFSDVGDERQALLIAEVGDGGVKALTEVDGAGAFAWRPDGNAVGLVRYLDRQSGYYAGLWLLETEGPGERGVTDDRVMCFFWSPDGSKIAYITPSEDAEGSVRWAVLEVDTESVRYLADFRPTQEQLTTFMFFDQYGQSHSPWSPDGRFLVFSGSLGYQIERNPLPEGPSTGVLVAPVEDEDPPRQIAGGVVGFWSRV